MTGTPVPGSHWRRKRSDGRQVVNENVSVVRITGGGKVVLQRTDGQKWDLPMSLFIGTYAPDSPDVCQRCGSDDKRYADDKYCRECLQLIGRVRNARRQEDQNGPVLTTRDPQIIQQRKQDDVAPRTVAVQEPDPEPEVRALTWRITGRRVITETVEVTGATVIDALASIDAEHPDLQITDVHLVD